MLIAIMTILFLSGGSVGVLAYISESKGIVKDVVVDDERKDAALDVLKSMEKLSKDNNRQAKQIIKDLEAKFEDYGVNTADIDAAWASHFEALDKHNHDMIDLRFELKEHITQDEWQEIFAEDRAE